MGQSPALRTNDLQANPKQVKQFPINHYVKSWFIIQNHKQHFFSGTFLLLNTTVEEISLPFNTNCKSQLTTAQILIEFKLVSFRTYRKSLCKSAKRSSLLLWMSIMLSRKGVSLVISAANLNEYVFFLSSWDWWVQSSLCLTLFDISSSDTCSDEKW